MHMYEFNQHDYGVTMNRIFQAFKLILIVLFVAGCNPFGKNSFINIIDTIAELPNQTSNINLNAGGSPTLTTVPPVGFSNHLIELSVGNQFQQTNYVSVQGNTLEVIVIGIQK